jgi:hypothetical protein
MLSKKILFLVIALLVSFSSLHSMEGSTLKRRLHNPNTNTQKNFPNQKSKNLKKRRKKRKKKNQTLVKIENQKPVFFEVLDSPYVCPVAAVGLCLYFGIPALWDYYLKDTNI